MTGVTSLELDADKRGPALRNRLEGEAAIHKRLLDRDRLKDPTNGCGRSS